MSNDELTAEERAAVLARRMVYEYPRAGYCHARGFDGSGFHSHQCCNKAKAGTDWCGRHSDEVLIRQELKRREDARARESKRLKRQRMADRSRARLAAFDGMHQALRDIADGMDYPIDTARRALTAIHPDAMLDVGDDET